MGAYEAMCEQIGIVNAMTPQPRLIADERVPHNTVKHHYDVMGRAVVYFHPSLLDAPKREADALAGITTIPIESNKLATP